MQSQEVDHSACEWMGSSGTRGGMSVLASFAARGREHWIKDQTSARDHSGGRVSKARGRLAAPGVPALEAVWHRRQEELYDPNAGGLWWGAMTGLVIYPLLLIISFHLPAL